MKLKLVIQALLMSLLTQDIFAGGSIYIRNMTPQHFIIYVYQKGGTSEFIRNPLPKKGPGSDYRVDYDGDITGLRIFGNNPDKSNKSLDLMKPLDNDMLKGITKWEVILDADNKPLIAAQR